jgi:polysaccharide export outer membrane protein
MCCFSGCATYQQNIMFKVKDESPSAITQKQLEIERNYPIQINDLLRLEVFSNKGERMVDPNRELSRNMPAGALNAQIQAPLYQVNTNGEVKFPMIGNIHLEALTLREAELLLQKEYDQYYKECFVNLRFENKRVVLLGATGGQVIPLVNENIKLTEALALAKGIANDGKAHNIRLIRDEEVFLIDLSTVDGLRKGNLIVQPGDIIYVEPLRRPFIEGLRDFSAVSSIIISLGTLAILLVNIYNN